MRSWHIILIIIAFSVVAGYVIVKTPHPADIDHYKACIKDRYGMTPVEVYQRTGKQPVCPPDYEIEKVSTSTL